MTEIIVKVDDKFLEVAKIEGMEDQYELIRCKDCKYWTQNPFGGKVGFCNKHKDIAIACDETDFCSWAERKENGNKLLCSKEQTDNR